MKRNKLSGRYAKALYDFSLEQNKEEEVYRDILLLAQVFKENRDLRVVIESPVMPADKKRAIFEAIFNEKISAISMGFLKLIITKKREPALPDIFDNFVQCYYVHHHIKCATLTVAVKIDAALLNQIQSILEEETHSAIIMQEIVNPKIIGGLIIHIDDFLFDASILGKINKLRTEFSHNIYQADF